MPVEGAGLLIARRIATESHDAAQTYPELAIETTQANTVEIRLACLIAEPPTDASPMRLQFKLPLGEQRLRDAPRPTAQPYLQAILKQQKFVLIVGSSETQLLSARSSPAAVSENRLWYRCKVVEVPPKPTNAGIDPNLRGAGVGLVGLGSVGSRAASLLAAAGASRLVLIDPDRLDSSNLRRHLCGPAHIGSLKVQAVAATLEDAGFETATHLLPHGVPREDSENVRSLLSACDVFICCADSGPAQQYVNHVARKLGKPAIIASIKLLPEALGEIVLTHPDEVGCLNCWRLSLQEQKLMLNADGHDPADYPETTPATPRGIPGFHLDQIAAVACDLSSKAIAGTSPRVWLNAMQMKVSGFDDLEVQRSWIEEITPQTNCLVCGL